MLPGARNLVSAILNSLLSPAFWLVALAVLCIALAMSPLAVAIGGYFWDVYLYPDAAWRISMGQLPHVDFFAPAGALGYYAYAFLAFVFPSGNPLLLAQWSVLLITLPLMAWIVPHINSGRGYLALAIVLPFVFFSFVPLNTKEVYPLAGVDAYGIYNRHICLLLYVMVTAVLFVPKGAKLAILVGLLFAALFFTKITGAIAGAIILAHALLAGRIGRWTLFVALALFLGICAVIEISGGIVSAYIRDILILVSMNSGGLLARFRSPAVMYLDILFPMVLLAMLLAWTERHRILFLMSPRVGLRMRARIAMIFDQDVFWIVMLVAVAIFFETQNTGSLAFIFAWPYLASVFARWKPGHRDRRTAVLLLIALTALPMVMPMLHRTIRVTAATTIYDPLKEPALGRYSAVEARSELLERAYAMNRHYGEAGENYRKLSASGHQSSYLLYSEIDFQMSWLIGAARAVEALREWETAQRRRLDRLVVLDFVDIFTPILQRRPVRLISIGMAADRTVPPLEGERLAEAHKADALLVPQCPSTPVRLSLARTFEPVLAGRQRVSLTPCWDIYVRN